MSASQPRIADQLPLFASTLCLGMAITSIDVLAWPCGIPGFLALFTAPVLIAFAAVTRGRTRMCPARADPLGWLICPLWWPLLLNVPNVFAWMLLCLAVPGEWSFAGSIRSALLQLVLVSGGCLPAVVALGTWWTPSARLFRFLQGLGLLQVGLAFLLSNALVVCVLALVYLATLLAVLGSPRLETVLSVEPAATACKGATWRGLGFAPLIAVLALALYLLTPPPRVPWDPSVEFDGRGSAPTAGNRMDLNEEGPIRLSGQVVIIVRATHADGSTWNDLPGDQRWRSQVWESYKAGVWELLQEDTARPGCSSEPPDLGPEVYHVECRHRVKRMLPVAAEPVRLAAGQSRSPIVQPAGDQEPPLFFEANGTLRANLYPWVSLPRYWQVVPARADRKRTPAQPLEAGYHDKLRSPPSAPLVKWADALVERLVQEGGYGLNESDLAVRDNSRIRVPANAERLARALTWYFVHSGEYSYTLNRPRHDRTIDPMLDFLKNSKAGHCERYAAGLALVLRSRGVPCRLVTGYMGAERRGPGLYLVRQSDAHAWVEVLVARPGQEGQLDWLTLDPTPANLQEGAGEPGSGAADLWEPGQMEWEAPSKLWDLLTDRRDWRRLSWPGVQRSLSWWWLALWVVLPVLVMASAGWLLRRRRPGLMPIYARLLALLKRHGIPPPRQGQTAREHAEAVAIALGSDVPLRVVGLYYRARFGNSPATAEEIRDLDEALGGLAKSLRGLKRSPLSCFAGRFFFDSAL